MNRSTQASALFIFITITLDSIGVGLIIPTLPDVMRRFIFDESSVAHLYGLFISIYAFMQFIASPLLGSLSDRYGRRPILLISLMGSAVDYLMMAYAPNLIFLFVGRVVSGLTGANVTVASAYMSDVSNDSNRSANFGMIGAGFGLGFIIGPAIGGLLGSKGLEYPFLAAAAFSFLNFLFGLFILPESLPLEKRNQMSFKQNLSRLNPLRSFQHIFTHKSMFAFIAIYAFLQLAGQVHPSNWTLYTTHKFGWTAHQVGFSLALVGILSAISQGGLTRILIPRIGESKAIFFGIIGQFISFFLFSIATSGNMMYGILIASSLFWVVQPALQSIISKSTPSNEQGELQGSLMSLSSLACIISPLIATSLFSFFSDSTQSYYYPGAAYAYGALMFALAGLVFYFKVKSIDPKAVP